MKARLPQGYGKQNVNQLMQQAQKLQEDMKAKQEEMEAASHTVTAGGGMVEITMTGAHEVTALKLKPEIVDPEDIEMLEDLLAAAVNEPCVWWMNGHPAGHVLCDGRPCRAEPAGRLRPVRCARPWGINAAPLERLIEEFAKLPLPLGERAPRAWPIRC